MTGFCSDNYILALPEVELQNVQITSKCKKKNQEKVIVETLFSYRSQMPYTGTVMCSNFLFLRLQTWRNWFETEQLYWAELLKDKLIRLIQEGISKDKVTPSDFQR